MQVDNPRVYGSLFSMYYSIEVEILNWLFYKIELLKSKILYRVIFIYINNNSIKYFINYIIILFNKYYKKFHYKNILKDVIKSIILKTDEENI